MSSDAAALPSPPGFAPWENIGHPGGQISRPDSLSSSNHATPAGYQSPRFSNIKDLQDEAAALDVNEDSSVCYPTQDSVKHPGKIANSLQLNLLLNRAQDAIENARRFADNDQPDKAYVQYLRASEITINIIPHHPDYRTTASQRSDWYKQFADLMMVWIPVVFIQLVTAIFGSHCSTRF
ncbi:unnamed protein product [Aspergillus oryzae]|uniref:Unnamed protein product n=1 Tax=Aspergillus oryzae TaxID=5062 RepID=A0AAN5BYR5_ASPOZ|nr:unnamed protein product [Aspergillus oryzae]